MGRPKPISRLALFDGTLKQSQGLGVTVDFQPDGDVVQAAGKSEAGLRVVRLQADQPFSNGKRLTKVLEFKFLGVVGVADRTRLATRNRCIVVKIPQVGMVFWILWVNQFLKDGDGP